MLLYGSCSSIRKEVGELLDGYEGGRSGLAVAGHRACRALVLDRRVERLTSIAARARSASLTALESGNTAATSGSSRTTFVPSAYRFAYLPRTPPRKS